MRVCLVVLCLVAGSALAQEASLPESGSRWRELGFQASYAFMQDAEAYTHRGLGVRVHLLARLGPYLAIGPEAALYAHAGSFVFITPAPGGGEQGTNKNRALLQLGGVVRAGLELGPVRPSLLMGLGWNRGVSRYLSYSAGAEVQVRLKDWLPLVFEVRYHDDLDDYPWAINPPPHGWTLGLGSNLVW